MSGGGRLAVDLKMWLQNTQGKLSLGDGESGARRRNNIDFRTLLPNILGGSSQGKSGAGQQQNEVCPDLLTLRLYNKNGMNRRVFFM